MGGGGPRFRLNRTIYNFTTREDSMTPKLMARKFIKKIAQEEEKDLQSLIDSGINYTKCVELLDDAKHFRMNKKKDNIKKSIQASRCNSIKDALDYFTPMKQAESLYQRTSPLTNDQVEVKLINNIGIDSEELEEEYIDVNECEIVLKNILKPYKLSYVFLDFLIKDYVFYKFEGTIGKQSKLIKRVMDRKIILDPKEGVIIEYELTQNSPNSPHRSINLQDVNVVEEIPRKWYMAKTNFTGN